MHELLKVVVSEREPVGDTPFYVTFPQHLAFFNKHVLLFASRGNIKHHQTLTVRVRRQR